MTHIKKDHTISKNMILECKLGGWNPKHFSGEKAVIKIQK